MRRKKLYGIMTLVLCGVLSVAVVTPVLAVNYDKKIEEAKKEKKEYSKKAEELQKEIEELEKSREDTLAYIEKLDKKTEAVEEELEKLKAKISETEGVLKTAEKELAAAQEEEQKQYDIMKKRIKYMYENGSQDYLEILFGSHSVADLLNRAEYIEKISAYDKRIFKEYEKVKNKVEQKKQEIEAKLSELEGMKEDQTAEKKALSKLKKKKKEQIKQYDKELNESQDKASEYARQAAKAEAEVEKLLEQKQDEIDKANDAGGGGVGGGDGSLRWPLKVSGRISSTFGRRSSPTAGASTYHKGIDIAASSGTPIVAAGAGTVVTATYSSSAGNYVMISHGNRLYTVYMHCSRLAVKEGDTVSSGQVIAYVGSTGISTGAHLHFGVSKNGSYVNPLQFVNKP
ncbi:MAG: peptidoglycan DD-metalloendopeptidase family protein [Eubacterium sp.]|nr:peptidoglycan DD-metalloendopeptidase family protein [Eubacterium sp.]